ncbi:MAG TPA: hypothetical protein VLT59_13625, partial [Steroidobacteraceae bacterium]|nr:hypothetical protein [Steroidobacteraceae bacterium]
MSAAIACAGCVTSPGVPERPPVAVATSDEIALYLDTMDALATADRDRQIDVFDEVERAYLTAPTTTNTLRYAAALVTAGHPDTDPERAHAVLVELLAGPGVLTPSERKLASILRQQAAAVIALETENRRLTATVDEQAQAQLSSARRT